MISLCECDLSASIVSWGTVDSYMPLFDVQMDVFVCQMRSKASLLLPEYVCTYSLLREFHVRWMASYCKNKNNAAVAVTVTFWMKSLYRDRTTAKLALGHFPAFLGTSVPWNFEHSHGTSSTFSFKECIILKCAGPWTPSSLVKW